MDCNSKEHGKEYGRQYQRSRYENIRLQVAGVFSFGRFPSQYDDPNQFRLKNFIASLG